jgi:FKBP-type peptidyl-prolyl cis-trans isomerase FklB
MAQDFLFDSKANEAPDKTKLSYALGMSLALQLKHSGTEVDISALTQALHDVMDGKPTQLQESEIRPLLMQAQAYAAAKKVEKNKREGDAFLAKNATISGVTVLPDGLQYRVLQEGTGEPPQSNDVVTLSFQGKWVSGTTFRSKDDVQLPIRFCPRGLQEALRLMKTGSKWEIAVPSNLAFGHQESRPGYGSALVYDLELVSSEPESDQAGQHLGGGRMGHSYGDIFFPPNTGD